MSINNINVLNAIRNDCDSAIYRERIPVATQENIALVGKLILGNTDLTNIFTNTLNRIGRVILNNRNYTNRLKVFKKGSMEYGNFIQEIVVDLIDGKEFNHTSDDHPFKRENPKIYQDMHVINSEKTYKTTIQRNQIERAFTSENGVMDLITAIIDKMWTSYELDEFTQTKMLLAEGYKNGMFYTVEIPELNTDNAHIIARIIKEYSDNITYMSSCYNTQGVSTHTPKDKQYLITTTKFDAYMDVDVLASAFNMEKVEFFGHRVQVDNFLDAVGVEAMLVDLDFVLIVDKLLHSDSLYNPQNMSTNHWLHVMQLFSLSKFNNAIAFTTEKLTEIDYFEKLHEFDMVIDGWKNQPEYWSGGIVSKADLLAEDFIEINSFITEHPDMSIYTEYGNAYGVMGERPIGLMKVIDIEDIETNEYLCKSISTLRKNEIDGLISLIIPENVIETLQVGKTYGVWVGLEYFIEKGKDLESYYIYYNKVEITITE